MKNFNQQLFPSWRLHEGRAEGLNLFNFSISYVRRTAKADRKFMIFILHRRFDHQQFNQREACFRTGQPPPFCYFHNHFNPSSV
jgi:hypothetical protein